MSDQSDDIDALLRYLKSGHTPHWYDDSNRWHTALAALIAEHDALRAERDEARREACLWALPRGVVWNEAMIARGKAIAAERGWDCFAQQEGGGA